jgi:hypothetical protein
LELRKDREKRKLFYFPLGGSKTDDCTWLGSLLISVAAVCGGGGNGAKGIGKGKDGMKKNTKPNNEKLSRKRILVVTHIHTHTRARARRETTTYNAEFLANTLSDVTDRYVRPGVKVSLLLSHTTARKVRQVFNLCIH